MGELPDDQLIKILTIQTSTAHTLRDANSVFFQKEDITSFQTKHSKKKKDINKKDVERLHTATPLLAASSACSSL